MVYVNSNGCSRLALKSIGGDCDLIGTWLDAAKEIASRGIGYGIECESLLFVHQGDFRPGNHGVGRICYDSNH